MAKDALILLPGTLCDERLWAHQTESLADIANVTIGDVTKDDSVKEMAQTILKQAPEHFALAGLSLGGIVAMEVVHQAPERVTKLALLNANPYGPKPEQKQAWDQWLRMVEEGRFSEITENHLLPQLIHPERQSNPQLTSTIMDMAEQIGPEAYVRQLRAVATRTDARERLRQIKCPTLLLVGRDDPVCPVQLHEEMAELIPHSTLEVIEHCGHLSTMECPEAVTSALQNWLRSANEA
ncbi:alpha/beta fold hydrolase [Bacillaceae bacterium SIJ1]|uniref:alpha/beta fold hydrolase n=1 Tax=Litoribacterium kuwaitense TaxID=1398745 RepID=UPI0013EB78EC|nr:alpha/beta fold hydrolase [Litoribacterium kuwaitense]NGP45688.1 alpha/beta fold hydrolase [Litoribacterium kuwaitense]